MKKLISMALTLCLAATLILPAAAVDAGLDNRLAQITLSVKQTLGIGDSYTDYSGHFTAGDSVNLWYLNWKSDKETIEVTATEAGKIVNYYRYDKNGYDPCRNTTKFPQLSGSNAKKVAQAFLAKVLDTKIESVDLDQGKSRITLSDNGSYNFYGALELNNLKTPIYMYVTVDSKKQAVTSFSRGDSGEDYAELPSAAKVSLNTASSTLFDTVKMQLNYVSSDKDQSRAILRYTPAGHTDYMVDALTGKLIEIVPQIYPRNALEDAGVMSAKGGGGLTEAELRAASDLKGAKSRSDLESAARGISSLGISSDYVLNAVNYYAENTDKKKDKDAAIYARLNFIKKSGTPQKESYSYTEKEVMLNAKTSDFISSTAYGYSEKAPTIKYNRAQSEKIARDFAQQYSADKMSQTVLEDAQAENNDRYETFTFVRQVNSIKFPENFITVTVDRTDGTIGTYYVNWDDSMTFADAAGIKTEQEAKTIFTKAAGIALCYANVPTRSEEKTELKLVYDFENQDVWGVDAATGTPLKYQAADAAEISYNDVSGHYAQKQIETLAKYGIGYIGGTFAPNQALTQKDALTLIVAARGYTLDQSEETYEDSLYSAAYSLGLLEETDRNPAAAVNRVQMTKLMVDAAGYGEVAKFKDIYRIGFKDDKAIPSDLFGYVAIAKGLGIVKGDASGSFHPASAATRAQLAVMLFNIMNR